MRRGGNGELKRERHRERERRGKERNWGGGRKRERTLRENILYKYVEGKREGDRRGKEKKEGIACFLPFVEKRLTPYLCTYCMCILPPCMFTYI